MNEGRMEGRKKQRSGDERGLGRNPFNINIYPISYYY